MRFVPVSISKEDAVVKARPMKHKLLLVKSKIAAGKNRKALKGVLFLISVFLVFCQCSLQKLIAKKRRIQPASPTDIPQH